MQTPREIAEEFNGLNFHDDTLIDIKVLPSQKRNCGGESMVEIRLGRAALKEPRTVHFSGCANLRVAMDFDVLAGNLAPNTSGSGADMDVEKIRELMRAQEVDWDVGYGAMSNSPLRKKIEEADKYVFFRVQFFGGVVEVIARDYEVTE